MEGITLPAKTATYLFQRPVYHLGIGYFKENEIITVQTFAENSNRINIYCITIVAGNVFETRKMVCVA